MPKTESGISVVTFDFQGLLAELTTDTRRSAWHEEDGPDSGCGLDYWYRHHRYGLVYINVDQGFVKISVCATDEVLYEGMLSEDETYGKFTKAHEPTTHGKRPKR